MLAGNSSFTYASPTGEQGKSGLGIDTQRQAVERYLTGGRWIVAAEYVETESGRRSDRPKLAAATHLAIGTATHHAFVAAAR